MYSGVNFEWLPKLVGVTLAFLVFLGLLKYFHLSQTPIMGYLLTLLVSGNGALAFSSGEGTLETSTMCLQGFYKLS